MNDKENEREMKERKIGGGSSQHLGPPCVREEDPKVLVFQEHPMETKG